MELICSPRCWHHKLSKREKEDIKLLMLFRLNKSLTKQISRIVCEQLDLSKVTIKFLPESSEDFGLYDCGTIELYGSGQNAECLVHELAHHLAESRKDKQKHGKKFVQAYKELILIVKRFLKEYV